MKDSCNKSFERLLHIKNAISEIEKFVTKKKRIEFFSNDILTSAILFQFSVIGEAIIHVESSILDKYEYPWYKIRAFRNLISHEYFNIKMEAVWEIIINDFPELKSVIDIIIKKECPE